MIANAVELARSTYENEEFRVGSNTATMGADLSGKLQALDIDSKEFANEFFGQLFARELSEGVIFRLGKDGVIRTFVLINPYDRPLDQVVPKARIAELRGKEYIQVNSNDRIGALSKLKYGDDFYLYASRVFDPEFRKQIERARDVQTTYRDLQDRSRLYQMRFNGALLLGALIIVGLAIFFALKIADRLVRPVGELVAAAGKVEEGDFSTRVSVHQPHDEVAMLATAFNRMTGRLQEQTGALMSANQQLDTRRAFIEAVLSSVTAGVIALDQGGSILLVNRSAENLLEPEGEEIEGRALGDVSAELAEFMTGDARDSAVTVNADSGPRTLAVKRVRYADGAVSDVRRYHRPVERSTPRGMVGHRSPDRA